MRLKQVLTSNITNFQWKSKWEFDKPYCSILHLTTHCSTVRQLIVQHTQSQKPGSLWVSEHAPRRISATVGHQPGRMASSPNKTGQSGTIRRAGRDRPHYRLNQRVIDGRSPSLAEASSLLARWLFILLGGHHDTSHSLGKQHKHSRAGSGCR